MRSMEGHAGDTPQGASALQSISGGKASNLEYLLHGLQIPFGAVCEING